MYEVLISKIELWWYTCILVPESCHICPTPSTMPGCGACSARLLPRYNLQDCQPNCNATISNFAKVLQCSLQTHVSWARPTKSWSPYWESNRLTKKFQNFIKKTFTKRHETKKRRPDVQRLTDSRIEYGLHSLSCKSEVR